MFINQPYQNHIKLLVLVDKIHHIHQLLDKRKKRKGLLRDKFTNAAKMPRTCTSKENCESENKIGTGIFKGSVRGKEWTDGRTEWTE